MSDQPEQEQKQEQGLAYTPPDEKSIALDPIGPPAPPPEQPPTETTS